MRLIVKISCLLFFLQSFSQTTSNQEKIKNYIDTYFNYDRESIHVQFNKNIYVNSEDLAFKGYVWSKNNNTPHSNTANVQLVVYNEQQEIIQKQLIFTTKGTFAGGLHLNNKFKTGKYYFHFYTNWMNNFTEDGSFMQTIEIIDKNEPYNFKTKEPDWDTAKITLSPEGGSILNDINNAVGISIKDCNQKGIETDGIVLDSKSNEVSQFHTNKMGNGVFYLIPNLNEKYTLKIKSDKLTIAQPLPKVQETGIIVTYNNNLPKNKLIIAVKTNEKGVELYQNKKFILLIQQNKNAIQQEIVFDTKETEKTLLFDKKYLSNGVNSIRLIDENLNEITERLVYISPVNSPITTLQAKVVANDSIQLSGKTELNQASLSISVLPENNVCINQNRSIQGTFYLNNYLDIPETDNYAYYDLENKERKQDMELLMLNQNKSKFLWDNIKSNPPKINHSFDKGVTISGKVEKKLNPNSKNRISLVSLKDNVFDEAVIDKNNDFKFENFFAQDSTVFVLQMINEKSLSVATKIEARVSPSQTFFSLPLQFDKTICPTKKNLDKSFTFSVSKAKDSIINLKEITIKSTKKDVLKHQKEMNFMATSFKVKEGDYGRFLDFLNRNGYRTGLDEDGNVFISVNRGFTGGNSGSPTVYIDNDIVLDNNLLFNLYMNEIDEIYMDKSGNSDVVSVGNGTIKIFLRENLKKDYYDIKYTSLIVNKGFAKNIKFKNSQFETQNEFYYFGTLNWSPNITIKDNQNYEIKLPKGNQKEIQVLLEGFSDDGQLVSETRRIPVSNP
ncbi:hypothetical protein SAMN05443549_1011148 [Flavobacterium fluvii]|uniref:Carboxypeptidase regulatory-like domain-containing protein n=1 Tax=Flavobacterium fluvii TaxID=468056 RepID=A0A1M5G8U5_9FLAO|nr:hypothetical protein [Flavobacterium fluvii]SHG00149.1 hypothetical protein SAMN05443549_1011148 [Flavobacterium fluvii]